ncbi:coiled-coil domain-containing protein 62 isoform X3 [Apteryx rowi]|uniref:coiled-coil domain-containing protein 62 isoform X3 n=1 Tax=Apteryx rowi TaxID=308060 RepID=UPI000E1D85B6|nr:coiled-coil domain-containing protein 62 isoform X3 [Apteryx rowi]
MLQVANIYEYPPARGGSLTPDPYEFITAASCFTPELKDRDKELNDMVAVHQRQLLAWEDDRQRILTLAERCNLLENELHKRNEIIKTLTKRLKLLESQQNDSKTTLEHTQQKFKELSQKTTDTTLHCQVLEEKNQNLNCSVLELSAKIGQLQAREQELLTMLKLKDKDILEATDHITEFTSKFKQLESALHAAKSEEFSINKEKQDFKLRLKELLLETNKLKDDLCEKMKENNEQREEIMQLKQENGYLKNELALSAEKANRKDQLLQFAKSKQVRTDTELSSLRQQIYVKQQRDLQFLHFNLESSQELRQKHEKKTHEMSIGMAFPAPESNSETGTVRSEGTVCEEGGTARVQKCRLKTIPEVCEVENGLLLNASDLEKTISANLNRRQKVVKGLAVLMEEEEKQDVASSSDEPDSKAFCDTNNVRPLRDGEISENGLESGEHQTFESSLPVCEHWPNFKSCVDSQSTLIQDTILSDKTDNEDKIWEERNEILCSQKSRETLSTTHKPESDSCSNNFIIKKAAWWKPISDLEWMKIFKPIKGSGNTWHRKTCNSLKTAQERKCASLKSEENADLNSFHLDSPCCLTSTQKGDRPQIYEKFSDADFPLEISNLSVIQPTKRCCNPTIDQEACSRKSKLQHLLAESRQMVADLELSTLLHASPRCSPNSSGVNTTTELAEALCRTPLPAAEESEAKLPFFSL